MQIKQAIHHLRSVCVWLAHRGNSWKRCTSCGHGATIWLRGQTSWTFAMFLGIHVKKNRNLGTLSLSQAKYVDNILDKFDMAKCSLISTTLTISCKLSSQNSPQDHDEARVMKNIPIRQVLGSLSYLMSCTILVWSFQLVFSHKFIERPCINHWLGLYILEVHTKYGTHL